MQTALLILNLVASFASAAWAVFALVRPVSLSGSLGISRGEVFYVHMYAARSIPFGLAVGLLPSWHNTPFGTKQQNQRGFRGALNDDEAFGKVGIECRWLAVIFAAALTLPVVGQATSDSAQGTGKAIGEAAHGQKDIAGDWHCAGSV